MFEIKFVDRFKNIFYQAMFFGKKKELKKTEQKDKKKD